MICRNNLYNYYRFYHTMAWHGIGQWVQMNFWVLETKHFWFSDVIKYGTPDKVKWWILNNTEYVWNLCAFTWKIAHSMILVFDVLVSIKWFTVEYNEIFGEICVFVSAEMTWNATNNTDNNNDNRIMNTMHTFRWFLLGVFGGITTYLEFHAISLYCGYFTNEFQSIFTICFCWPSWRAKCIELMEKLHIYYNSAIKWNEHSLHFSHVFSIHFYV